MQKEPRGWFKHTDAELQNKERKKEKRKKKNRKEKRLLRVFSCEWYGQGRTRMCFGWLQNRQRRNETT